MEEYLKRIANALERAFPLDPDTDFFEKADAFIWEPDRNHFSEVTSISTIDISLLKGMDKEIKQVTLNTKAFADGNLANNVLVWGARGMGKSTLIKSVVKATSFKNKSLKIIEVARDDIGKMNSLLKIIKNLDKKFIIFCINVYLIVIDVKTNRFIRYII